MKKIIIISFLLLILVLCAGCYQMSDKLETLLTAPSQSAAQSSQAASEYIVETPSASPAETRTPAPALETVYSEQMTLSFNFGERTGIYSGEILDGLPHGTGAFDTKNEDGSPWSYEGVWSNGHMNGEGITLWDDGFKEIGTYAGDYLNGQGAEYQGDILIYEGDFVNSVYHGQGKLLNIAGKTVYEGNFSYGFIDESTEERQARLAPFQQQCQTIAFEEYANNDQEYIGKDIQLTGRIFDVWEPYEGEEYYCDLLIYEQDNISNIARIVYYYGLNEAAFQDETIVNIWGTISGMYTYTTEDGRELTVPEIEAWSIQQYEP